MLFFQMAGAWICLIATDLNQRLLSWKGMDVSDAHEGRKFKEWK